ncbi:MAG: response regulator [Phenylobacterium sp.]|nr:response regulator [Phenylobacterium sp.]MBP8246014.1 response regulator [Phenylobacterium sp.]
MIKSVSRNRHAYVAVVLGLCYIANLWLTNVLRQQAGGIDTIWTANAFVIGALLLLPARWGPPTLLAGFAIQAAVVLMFNVGLVDSIGFSVLNTVEAVGVVWLARRLRVVRLTTPSRFAGLIFLALLPILVVGSALLGAGAWILHGEFPVTMLANRLPAKLLGMGLVLPAILLLGHNSAAGLMQAALWQRLSAYLLMVGLAALVFTPFSAVALFVAFPAITLVGLRLGPRAVILAMGLTCMVMLPLGIQHAPPALLTDNDSLNRRITLTQVYLAMVFATGLIAALMATHQQRLRQILARRSASYMRARDRAQAASVAKTEFLAAMSHEIRTPLNSIIGFAQVLERRDDLPADSRHQIGLIGRSGGALLTVVNDILDFSKVEAGRFDLDPKPVDLTQACQSALAIVADGAQRKGLTLAMTFQGEAGAAHVCDDHRLGQVLLNLLNNAVKFTDAGGVTLALSVASQGEHDLVRIAVVDTGPGIAPDAAGRLFQRFSQVDSSVSRTHGGTGLGLAICKGLVDLMGGKVGVESTPGQGSTFWLEIPMARAEAIAEPAADEGRQQGLSAHILLVDDHPMNRELGLTVLTLLGCTADVACDGREAIEVAQRRRYDAILMDVHMPVVDGLAATRAIRALTGPVSRTPIIAMSADVLPEQVARMAEAGMVDSVGKPISIQALHDCLARWIGRDADGEVLAA